MNKEKSLLYFETSIKLNVHSNINTKDKMGLFVSMLGAGMFSVHETKIKIKSNLCLDPQKLKVAVVVTPLLLPLFAQLQISWLKVTKDFA